MARNVNCAPILAREADAIEAAILATPREIEAIAVRFNRSPGTIRRVGYARGTSARRCSSSTTTSVNPSATSRVSNTNNLSHISTVLSPAFGAQKLAETGISEE